MAIVRLRSLGDCVLTTPAIRILKAARPDLVLAVVVEDRFRELFSGNPDVETVLPPEVFALRRFRSTLCINFHGGTRSLTLTAASGARLRAGFAHYRTTAAYNLLAPRAQQILGEERTVHTAEHLASMMFWLGVPEVPVPRACLFASAPAGPKQTVVMHPVAATPEKTWPASGFLEVARQLRRDGLDPVFIGSAQDDLSMFSEFSVEAGGSLARTKQILAGAALFIGNDSGPAHMAAAFGVPVVALFGPSDAVVWAPWRVDSQVLQAQPIASVPVESVLEAAARLRRTVLN